MDYSTVLQLKSELHIDGSGDDTLIQQLVTAASRTLDHECTGSPIAVDYFKLETVVNERLSGTVDAYGNILVFPRKCPVNSVSAIGYRLSPVPASWTPIDLTSNPDLVEIVGPTAVKGWALLNTRPQSMQVQLSYSGGYDTVCTGAGFPADLLELCTMLAGRFYRESEGGFNDSMGIATIGSLIYTKGLPERFRMLVEKFRRKVPYS